MCLQSTGNFYVFSLCVLTVLQAGVVLLRRKLGLREAGKGSSPGHAKAVNRCYHSPFPVTICLLSTQVGWCISRCHWALSKIWSMGGMGVMPPHPHTCGLFSHWEGRVEPVERRPNIAMGDCLSYCSISMKRHHNQGNSSKERI